MNNLVRVATLAVLFALAGCSGGGSAPRPHPGSPVGPFVLTVSRSTNTLLSFKVDNSGALIPVSDVTTGTSPSAFIIESPQTFQQNVFVIDFGSNDLTRFNLDATTGVLSQAGNPIVTGGNPVAINLFTGFTNAGAPFGFIYVLNQASGSIAAFQITDQSGDLLPLPGSPFGSLVNPVAMTVVNTAQGFLFTTDGATISVFRINPDGSLTEVLGSPFSMGGNITSLAAVNLANVFLYASDAANNDVLGFTVTGTGSLLPLSGSPFPAGTQPMAVQIGIGDFLYVANGGSGNISGFSVNASNGNLMPIPGSPFAAGTNPSSIATDSHLNLYVANTGSNNITAFTADSGTGALTPVPGSPFGVASPNWIEAVFIMNVD